MKSRFIFIALSAAFVALFSTNAFAVDSTAVSNSRPKVGLVLAGGGAKGAAHIGAIKYIEDKGIPIDYVAGTSMGSVVGGLYALGYTPDQIKELFKGVDWSFYFGNGVEREQTSYWDKYYKAFFPINVPFSLKAAKSDDEMTKMNEMRLRESGELVNNAVSSPLLKSISSGLVNGDNFLNLFNDLCVGYQDSVDFSTLPIPYTCVATDMLNGEEFDINSGKIAHAMRSSMAIPIFFAPVQYGDRLLVDGGMVNNFPTDICREMGADIIIGVELNEGFKANTDDVNSMPGLLGQLFKIVTSGRNAENRRLCNAYIRPDVTGFGMMSFNAEAVDSLIVNGYKAAAELDTELEKIVALTGTHEPHLNAPAARRMDDMKLNLKSVSFSGLENDETDWLMRKWPIPTDREITADEIRDAIHKYKGTGLYKTVNYSIHDVPGEPDRQTIEVAVTKRQVNSFQMGFWADTEEAVAVGARLALGTNKISGWNGSATARLSSNPYAQGKLTYSALGFLNFNLQANVAYKMYAPQFEGKNYENYRSLDTDLKLYVSNFYARFIDVGGGLYFDRHTINDNPNAESNDESSSYDRTGLFAHFNFNNMDSPYYARHGMKLSVDARYSFFTRENDAILAQSGKAFDHPASFEASGEWYFTPSEGKLTIIPKLYYRKIFNDSSYSLFNNFVGGMHAGRYVAHQIPFVGMCDMEYMPYSSVGVARLDLQYNFAGKQYITLMCNYLRNAERIFQPIKEGYKTWGAILQYSVNTALGPVALGLDWTNYYKDRNQLGFYIALGCYF